LSFESGRVKVYNWSPNDIKTSLFLAGFFTRGGLELSCIIPSINLQLKNQNESRDDHFERLLMLYPLKNLNLNANPLLPEMSMNFNSGSKLDTVWKLLYLSMSENKEFYMLVAIGSSVLGLWALGLATSQTSGGAIHLLLIIALFIFLIRYVEKRV
jgi:hypothetical protein